MFKYVETTNWKYGIVAEFKWKYIDYNKHFI